MVLCVQKAEELYKNIIGWVTITTLGLVLAMEISYGVYLHFLAAKELWRRIKALLCKKREETRKISLGSDTSADDSRNGLGNEM